MDFTLRNYRHIAQAVLTRRVPMYAHFGITHRCNMRCRMCAVWQDGDATKELDIQGIGAFMPISQVERFRVDDLTPYVGQKLRCCVSEVDRADQNLVVSRRDLMEQAIFASTLDIHDYKIAAMEKTIAFPADPWFQLGDPRLLLALAHV